MADEPVQGVPAGMSSEEYGRRILQQLDENSRELAALKLRETERLRKEAEEAEAERLRRAPEEADKARELILTELGKDPKAVLNTVADAGARKGYELARRDFEQRTMMEKVAAFGNQVINANPDLAMYRPMMAETFQRLSVNMQGASIEQITKATVDEVRRFKEQAFEEEKRRREREDRARTIGGMPFGGGSFHTDSQGRQMDEQEMREARYKVIMDYSQKAREGRRGRAA